MRRRAAGNGLLVILLIGTGVVTASASPTPGPAVPGGGGQAHAGLPPPGSTTPNGTSAAPQVDPTTQIQGIDIASYQHPNGAAINWTSVASSGVRTAYVKATEGTTYVNPYYAGDAAAAKRAGLFVGAYEFARPDSADPAAQADALLSAAPYGGDALTLPPMLDLEAPYPGSGVTGTCWGLTTARMSSWIQAFVAQIRARIGQPPLIYTTAGWWNQCTGANSSYGSLPLTIANWSSGPGPLPAGWSKYTFWQYSSTGSVPGISGNVDLDAFNGSLTDLQLLAGSPHTSQAPAAIYRGTSSLLFATGADGKLDQTTSNANGTWSAWFRPNPVGTISSAPAALNLPNGQVAVFATAPNQSVYEMRYIPGSGWSGWTRLGGPFASAPSAIYRGSSILVFATGTDGKLYQTTSNTDGTWSAWFAPNPVGTISSAPAALNLPNGQVAVFATAPNQSVQRMQYTPGSGWSGWGTIT